MAKNRCAWQRSLIRLGTEMFPAAYASTIRASICKDTDSDQFTNATCKINIYININMYSVQLNCTKRMFKTILQCRARICVIRALCNLRQIKNTCCQE